MNTLKLRMTLLTLCVLLIGSAENSSAQTLPSIPDGIEVRQGYTLTIAQDQIQAPRFMEIGPDGTLYVSLPGAGEIKACMDKDNDGYYETVTTFIDNHNTVQAMQWHDNWLWFAESGAIFKARDNDQDGKSDVDTVIISQGKLPAQAGHWWRSLLIHNNRLYTSVGDRGNVTDEKTGPRQKIWTFALDGSDRQLFASGIRNTEKLVVRPGTDEVWGMDHGSDNFGAWLEKKDDRKDFQPITDEFPPGEMNHYVEGGFYGHPFIVGNRIPRPEFRDRPDILELAGKTIIPAWASGPHWAPNAMEFYTGNQFPASTNGNAFVAYHGSWNRIKRSGYCVTQVFFDQGKPYGELKFVNFLAPQARVIGRPVDVVVAPDGSLLISDDFGNRIYRLRYHGKK